MTVSKKEIESLKGYGARSFEKIHAAIEKCKDVDLSAFIASFGIPLVGRHLGRILEKEFKTLEALLAAVDSDYYFSSIDGIGDTKGSSLVTWLKNDNNRSEVIAVAKEVPIVKPMDEAKDNPFNTLQEMESTRNSLSWAQNPSVLYQKRRIMSSPAQVTAQN